MQSLVEAALEEVPLFNLYVLHFCTLFDVQNEWVQLRWRQNDHVAALVGRWSFSGLQLIEETCRTTTWIDLQLEGPAKL